MFRLISLNINDWFYLGHIPENSLVFVPKHERVSTKLPYTSVLIGPNGTGKSTLLKYIGEIFEDIEFYKRNGTRRKGGINFPYSIKYILDSDKIQITHKQEGIDRIAYEKGDLALKWKYNVSINGISLLDWTNLPIPSRVIAVSYLAMDRFRQKKNDKKDYYQYLGLRHRSNAASPSYFLNNTLPLLFDYISESKSVMFLKRILNFMGMDDNYLGIQLEYRYKKYFFKEKITASDFNNLFSNFEQFSKRTSTPFAVEYYKTNIEGKERLIDKIVKYLQIRTMQDKIRYGEKSLLEFNLFENYEVIDELGLILHLQKLDLLASATLLFKKKNNKEPTNAQNLSSGEFHFLTTMIAIQSAIRENALILIDEPDTSLHPNWQMKYANQLKNLFIKWNSVQFVLATHSHLLVSDLDDASSEVIGLTGSVPNIKARPVIKSTHGWSAEQVLLEVFQTGTTRNYFFIEVIDKILKELAAKDFNKQNITDEILKLKEFDISGLSESDPIKEIVLKMLKKVE